jgi:hypothetical protein
LTRPQVEEFEVAARVKDIWLYPLRKDFARVLCR